MAGETNQIDVLVQFRADIGNTAAAIKGVQAQLNSLMMTNSKLAVASGKALPGLDQQVMVLRALASQGDKTAQSFANLNQSSKTFYQVFSGNVKQNLAALFKSRLAVGQTMGALKEEMGSVQLFTGKTFTSMGTMADNWGLKMRTMSAVAVERLHRVSVAMTTAGKQMQWVGRQLIVGLTAPILGVTYLLTKQGLTLAREQTELAKFLQTGTESAGQLAATINEELAPALRNISEELGQTQEETTAMAASWAAAGFTDSKTLIQITQLTEELATLTQGDIDLAQAQELVRTVQATYGLTIGQTRKELEALQVIQSSTSLQMKDIANSLPIITAPGKQLDLSATQLAAMLAGVRQLGVDANVAANAYKHAFASLAAPTTEAAEMFKKTFGTAIDDVLYDKNGKPKGMAAFQQLSDMFTKLNMQSPQKATELAATLFGSRQYGRMLQLFESIQNKQSDFWKSLNDTADASKNAAFWQQQLETVMSSLSKIWDQIQVRLQNVAASLGQLLLPMVERAANSFVHMLEVMDKIAKASPNLVEWIGKIAGALAAIGPAIYGFGILGKLLPGQLLSGVSGLGRSVFGIKSIESEQTLQAMAATSPSLAIKTIAGMPKPGVLSQTPEEIDSAMNMLAGSITGGSSYGNRALWAKMGLKSSLGMGNISGIDDTLVNSIPKELMARMAGGGAVTDEESKLVKEISYKFWQSQGQNLDEVEKLLQGQVVAEGNAYGFLTGPNGALQKISKTGRYHNVAAEELEAAKRAEMMKGFYGSDVIPAGGAPKMFSTQAFESGAAKGEKVSFTKWIYNTMFGISPETAAKEVEASAEKTGTTFGGKLKQVFTNFKNLFNTKEVTAIAQNQAGGFTAILMQFTSLLPELIVLVAAAALVLKNWRAIWEGLQKPIAVAMELLKEAGQIWKDAFSNAFGGGAENGVDTFWKEFGKTIGDVIVLAANLAKTLSSLVAPALANILKFALDTADAFIKLLGPLLGVNGAFSDFMKNTSIAAKIGAIALAIAGLVKIFFLAKAAMVAFKIEAFTTALETNTLTGSIAGLRAAFVSLGTTGVLLVITAIAFAFQALSQSSNKAAEAVIAGQKALADYGKEFADFLTTAKGQPLDEFRASAKQTVQDMLTLTTSLIDAKHATSGWGGEAEDVNAAFQAMSPVLEQISQLNKRQLRILKQQTEEVRVQLEQQRLMAQIQLAAQVSTAYDENSFGFPTEADFQAAAQHFQELRDLGFGETIGGTGDFMGVSDNQLADLAKQGALAGMGFTDAFVQQVQAGSHDAINSLRQLLGSGLPGFADFIDESGLSPLAENLNNIEAQLEILDKMDTTVDVTIRTKTTETSISSMQNSLNSLREQILAVGDASKKTGKDMENAFKDALEAQLAQTTSRVTDAILTSFDQATEKMLSSIDKQIEAIQKQNEKEDWLQQQRDYRQQRDKMRYDADIAMAISAAERQKAINEGRFDDARIIELQALQAQRDNADQLKDLNQQHNDDVDQHNDDAKIERLQKQKDELQKTRDIMRTRLANILSEITEFGANSKAKWLDMYQKMKSTAQTYGVSIQSTSHQFFQAWGHTVNDDLADAFHDATIAAREGATNTGKAIADGFKNGLSQNDLLAKLAEAGKILTQMSALTNNPAWSHIIHGDPSAGTPQDSQQYKNLLKQYTQLINQITNAIPSQKKHSGGMIHGSAASDVPIMAQQGEFILQRSAVQQLGAKNLTRMNNEPAKFFHTGGTVGNTYENEAHADKRKIFHTGGVVGNTYETDSHADQRKIFHTGGTVGNTYENKAHADQRKIFHEGGLIGDTTKAYLGAASKLAIGTYGNTATSVYANAADFLTNHMAKMMAGMGKTIIQGVTRSLANAAGAIPAGTVYAGTASVHGGRNGATPGETALYDWITDHTSGIGGYLGVGHATTGNVGYSQHAYGNATDWFGTATDMMSGFMTIVRNATGPLKGLLAHVIHAGKKWSWNGGYGNYTPPSGTSDYHYGHIHTDALPEYGGTPPGYPLSQGSWYKSGGMVTKNGSRAHAGEYVLNSAAVKRIGAKTLDGLNFSPPKFNANDLRFSAPHFAQLGGTPSVAQHTNNTGDIIIKVEIDRFFGDENSYRELYQTLERVGTRVARERGMGNTMFRGNPGK